EGRGRRRGVRRERRQRAGRALSVVDGHCERSNSPVGDVHPQLRPSRDRSPKAGQYLPLRRGDEILPPARPRQPAQGPAPGLARCRGRNNQDVVRREGVRQCRSAYPRPQWRRAPPEPAIVDLAALRHRWRSLCRAQRVGEAGRRLPRARPQRHRVIDDVTNMFGWKQSDLGAMRRAFRQYLLPACIILMSLVVVLSFNEGRAQMSTDAYAWKHFLDEPPAAADLSPLPIGARDVLLAKVRIVGRIFWRGKRDQSGQAPPPPKRIFGAEVEIVDVLSGNAAKGARHIVSFGVPILGRRDMYPVTPRMYARDYFIV